MEPSMNVRNTLNPQQHEVQLLMFPSHLSSPVRPCYDASVADGGNGQQTRKAMANGSGQPRVGGFFIFISGRGANYEKK